MFLSSAIVRPPLYKFNFDTARLFCGCTHSM
nr:MAG TPA: hypothetical protein [Caudoviricetes sp.]